MMKIVIATKNRHKFTEISCSLAGIEGISLVSLNDFPNAPDVIEDGETFEENAVKKASEIAEYIGLPAMADDSGIVVDALDGRPGVLSARYGGPGLDDGGRNRLLLGEVRGVPPQGRTARFVCVIAVAFPGGGHHTSRGECAGCIADEMSGTHGFGYDPIFFLPEYGKTMAEIPLEEKNRISHRARAIEGMRTILAGMTGGTG
ncbi:MAG: XTP/dITP diphosphatase [Spirochaetes bacterium]|nr:XTP/dITP diphosphatase [Spirochaetota bacterium]